MNISIPSMNLRTILLLSLIANYSFILSKYSKINHLLIKLLTYSRFILLHLCL